MKYVGITSRHEYSSGKSSSFVSDSYLDALKDLNLIPIILPLNDCSNALVELCDGFIITGGNDIDPSYYDEKNKNCRLIDDQEDELDFKVLDEAVKKNKPVLGICKGIQSLNVYFGGTLYQDVTNHYDIIHTVKKECCTFLDNFLDEVFPTNSYHHQTIKQLGDDLQLAYSSNGSVEAIVSTKYKMFGVAFHPELSKDRNSRNVFKAFQSLFTENKDDVDTVSIDIPEFQEDYLEDTPDDHELDFSGLTIIDDDNDEATYLTDQA